MTCIFCKKPISSETVAHVIPQSLGGDGFRILPPGLECAACNQYFGSKVESLALSSFPFLPYRIFMQIPTAKRKSPKLQTPLGLLQCTGTPGVFGMDCAVGGVEQQFWADRQEGLVLIPAMCTQPLAVARLLLKMGIEAIAYSGANYALQKDLDEARQFARAPKNGTSWWFTMRVDHDGLFSAGKIRDSSSLLVPAPEV